MKEQVRECVEYFRVRPGYHRILIALRQKYERFGRAAGTVQLPDASNAECEAARLLFGRPFSAPVRFQASQFETALQQTRFQGVCPKEVLEAYFGVEIKTNREVQETQNRRLASILDQAAKNARSETSAQWVHALEERRGQRILPAPPGGCKRSGIHPNRLAASVPEHGLAGAAIKGADPPGRAQRGGHLRSPRPGQWNAVRETVPTPVVLPFRSVKPRHQRRTAGPSLLSEWHSLRQHFQPGHTDWAHSQHRDRGASPPIVCFAKGTRSARCPWQTWPTCGGRSVPQAGFIS